MKRLEIYRCAKCGNIVEVLNVGDGTLSCCDQPMQLLTENTVEASKEKHVPVIEKIPGGYRVKVGSVEHPMEEKHYIQWISLIADGKEYVSYLKPGQKPEAEFLVNATTVTAREYCNLHGLWTASV
jgi:superoxide reductase